MTAQKNTQIIDFSAEKDRKTGINTTITKTGKLTRYTAELTEEELHFIQLFRQGNNEKKRITRAVFNSFEKYV